MKINNNRGFHHLLFACLVKGSGAWPVTQSIAVGVGGVLIAAAVWHIPAWEQAKANHTEAAYQAQKMWPQQLFAKLPGGDNAVVSLP